MKKKLFKNFVVHFDDNSTIHLNASTQKRVLAMLNWLSINQPRTNVADGSSFSVRKTAKNGFVIYSYDSQGRIDGRFIRRNAIAFASQYLKEFYIFLDRSTGTVRYSSVREARRAKRAKKAALYENE